MTRRHLALSFVDGGLKRALQALLCAATLLTAGAAASNTVTFFASDLTDTTAGQDLWRYDYQIGGPIDAFGSVNLLFPANNYSELMVLSAAADFAPSLVQPDSGLGTDGILYATHTFGLAAATTAPLSLSFVWTSTGMPGSQAFEVIDGQGALMATGVTTAVPEPSSALLMIGGLVGVAALRRRRWAPRAM